MAIDMSAGVKAHKADQRRHLLPELMRGFGPMTGVSRNKNLGYDHFLVGKMAAVQFVDLTVQRLGDPKLYLAELVVGGVAFVVLAVELPTPGRDHQYYSNSL